ncbi:MAG: hypothetical protein V3S40_01375, partial [Kiloniellales bacterium]
MDLDEAGHPVGQDARQRAVVVLGAGRSGTSAVARGVQALGVELGDRLRPGGGKNPTGFFEDQDLLRLNKRLKRVLGIRGDSVALIEPAQWRSPAVEALRREAVETTRRRFGQYPLWGYKYGRTLRMLPFWEDVYRALDLDVQYVVAVRNPLSVAKSRGKLDPRRGTQEKSDLEWLVNVVPYFGEVRKRPFVVVDYDHIMADPGAELERLATALGLPVTAETRTSIEAYANGFLKPGMRHSRFSPADLDREPGVNQLVRDAYGWLHRLATDDIGPEAPELWADWERIERELAALAPILRHLDRLEADLRRAKWNPAGPLQAVP